MRAVLGLLLLTSSTFALSASKFSEDVSQILLDTNNTTDSNLNSQCSQFVKSCLSTCEKETINNFTSTCSSREATCMCNDTDFSSKIFATMLQGVPGTMTNDKNTLQVESTKNNKKKGVLNPVQFNAVLGDVDNESNMSQQAATTEEEKEEGEQNEMDQEEEEEAPPQQEFQQMEFIHPQPQLVKRPIFQESYCSHFILRCKQDCPAAFNSYSCDTNKDKTGFLLSCVCNYVDIAASVDAQVQAEL